MVDIFRKMGADYITYEKWNTDEVKMRYYSHSTIPRGIFGMNMPKSRDIQAKILLP